MDAPTFTRAAHDRWDWMPAAPAHVPIVFHGGEALLHELEEPMLQQAARVAALPGIVQACHLLPNAGWRQGFPAGGVAAFDAAQGGVFVPAGVGFEPWSGTRCLRTGITLGQARPLLSALADGLRERVPCGPGARTPIELSEAQMTGLLQGGAGWAVEYGWGRPQDLARLEDGGRVEGARTEAVGADARRRQRLELGTLGGGGDSIDVLHVDEVLDQWVCDQLGVQAGLLLVAVRAGSRGLGQQVVVDTQRAVLESAGGLGMKAADRSLAAAPLLSEPAHHALGALRAAANAALANRQVLTHLVRQVFARLFPRAALDVLFDVSRDTCRHETLQVGDKPRDLVVHRRDAVRLLAPGHPDLPAALRAVGQPLLLQPGPGRPALLTISLPGCEDLAFASGFDTTGRRVARPASWRPGQAAAQDEELRRQGVLVRRPAAPSDAEPPALYKSLDGVAEAGLRAGLLRPVARLSARVSLRG